MSAADEAYAKAVEHIAKAKAEGLERLSFDSEEFRALQVIPEEIAELKALPSLDLDNTQVSDLSPLAALTGLQKLDLNQTGVTDLSPLAALTGLQRLYLTQTGVTDLSPLAALTGLQGLSFDQTGVTDLAPLAALTGLQGLRIAHCPVVDLRPLRALDRLATDPDPIFGGLSFKACGACDADPEIAAIAEIKDNKDRAARLFDYLKDWVPPGEEVDFFQCPRAGPDLYDPRG